MPKLINSTERYSAQSMQCNKRNTKCLVWTALVIIAVYVPVNIIYMLSMESSDSKSSLMAKLSGSLKSEKKRTGEEGVAMNLKDIVPQPDGSVDLVMSLNIAEMMKILDLSQFGHPSGEMTSNPLPANFSIIRHNPNICKENPGLQWIIYVHTAPGNVNRRKILRNTWASNTLFKDKRTMTVFMAGTPTDPKEQKILDDEYEKYGDIVQGDFVEHYKNLTLKGIMGLKWTSTFCKNALFALKTDDDAFVNIFRLMEIVEQSAEKKPLVVCPLWKENTMPILRDPTKCMKWCVKYNEFPGKKHFPKYCAGLGFLMSREIIPQMYEMSKSTPFFWIDDVYVTGLLPPKISPKVSFIDLLKNFTLKEQLAFDQYTKAGSDLNYVFAHVKKEENFYKMWDSLLHRQSVTLLKQMGENIFADHPSLKDMLGIKEKVL